MQEGRGNAVGRCFNGDLERVAHESLCGFTGATVLQCIECADASSLQADEVFDGLGTGTDFAHGVQVQLEVAVVSMVEAIVRFLA